MYSLICASDGGSSSSQDSWFQLKKCDCTCRLKVVHSGWAAYFELNHRFGCYRHCKSLFASVVSAFFVCPQAKSIRPCPLELKMLPATTPSSSPSDSTSDVDGMFRISLAEIVNPAAFAISARSSAFFAFFSFSWRPRSDLTSFQKCFQLLFWH